MLTIISLQALRAKNWQSQVCNCYADYDSCKDFGFFSINILYCGFSLMLAVVESQASFRVPLQRGLRYTKCNLYLNEKCNQKKQWRDNKCY